MKMADLLRDFKVQTPEIQKLIEAVAEHAYLWGRRDQAAEMTKQLQETDRRVVGVLDQPKVDGEIVTRLGNY